MTGDENPDPIGEYVKECPYCGDTFTAGHMNRQFCPEKNGYKDYCKNRYKRRIKDELAPDNVDLSTAESENEPIKNPEAETVVETPIELNKLIIQNIMSDTSQKNITSDILDHNCFDINYFDSRTPIPGTNNYLVNIGDYTLEWIGREGTVLTFKITRI